MYTVGKPSMKLLRLAARFAQPEGDPPAPKDPPVDPAPKDPPPDPKDKKTAAPPVDDRKAVPFARFSEVSQKRRTAERSLATVTAERDTLKTQLDQAQSGDQATALKAAQEQVTELNKSIQKIDDEFEDMLEVALADVEEDDAKMIREIPGGARAQFAWFNKHRARLAGGEKAPTDEKKKGGVKSPTNEKKPGGGENTGPSSAAKSYVDQSKPKEKGFAGLA